MKKETVLFNIARIDSDRKYPEYPYKELDEKRNGLV